MSTTEMPRPGAMLFQIHLPACHTVTRRPTLLDIKQLHLMACLGDTLVWWGASFSEYQCLRKLQRASGQHIDIDLTRPHICPAMPGDLRPHEAYANPLKERMQTTGRLPGKRRKPSSQHNIIDTPENFSN